MSLEERHGFCGYNLHACRSESSKAKALGLSVEQSLLCNKPTTCNREALTGKQDWMRDYLKRLKVCIKWVQKSFEDLAMEKDNLHNMLDSLETNYVKAANISSLKASLAREESRKLDILDSHQREKEARIVSYKNQDSLREELQSFENDASGFKEKH
nr:kinesin-like protein KIN-14C [Tanacetum cinerariifolium]